MHAEVLITWGGVDERTNDWKLDLTAMKQIQPLKDTKQDHLIFLSSG